MQPRKLKLLNSESFENMGVYLQKGFLQEGQSVSGKFRSATQILHQKVPLKEKNGNDMMQLLNM